MGLSPEAEERLADLVELQPTTNGELGDRWGLDSGSDVHAYLEAELADFYYRDDNSKIRATPAAVERIRGEDAADQAVSVSSLQSAVLDVLPGQDSEPQSVVSTLHDVQADGVDTDVDAVRSALYGLVDMGIAERVERTVPTFRLAVDRDSVSIEVADPA
ncbi:MAG: DUF5797 family protein [Salinirussus sp.]